MDTVVLTVICIVFAYFMYKSYKKGVDKELFGKALSGDIALLTNPLVSVKTVDGGITPLHILALLGKREVIEHPKFNIVKDKFGLTPSNYLRLCVVIKG